MLGYICGRISAAVALVHEMGPLESPIQPQTIAVLRMINLIILTSLHLFVKIYVFGHHDRRKELAT